jgi:ParB family chromosome partitioning protein
LGRGLGALIQFDREASEAEPLAGGTEVTLDSIDPNPYQPRRTFEDERMAELTESVRKQGLLQPLLVRQVGERFQLIAGERRWRAAQSAGLERVPVIVRNVDDAEALQLALVENLQREDLNPLEEAEAYQRLIKEFRLTQDEIAQEVGKKRSTIANTLRLLQLPAEIRAKLADGTISAGHARSLLSIGSAEKQLAAVEKIIQNGLSVRDTERVARKAKAPPTPDLDVQAVEQDLSRLLGTRVRVHAGKGGAGRIEIEYYSMEELNGLIARLAGSNRAAGAVAAF